MTIKELTETIMDVVGFVGKPVFDTSKPDGTMRKLMDVSTLRALGYCAYEFANRSKTNADFLENSSN